MVVLSVIGGQINGAGGALAADALRAVVGPKATARIEATYLTVVDTVQGAGYALGGRQVHTPWQVAPASGTRSPLTLPAPPAVPRIAAGHTAQTFPVQTGQARRVPMQLAPIAALVTPGLPGEGLWTTDGLPAAGRGAFVPLAKAFLRPDPARPWAVVTILQIDPRVTRLHIVAGTREPGGPAGQPGTGLIPAADRQGNRLLAVFNGGFKYADGAYGLMSGGHIFVRPVWGAATVALTRNGGVLMGPWGLDRRLSGANGDLVAWRQNAALVVARGQITAQSQEGSGWGLSIMNSVYTWRSGIGLTRQGAVLYVAGPSLSAATLATALRAAGAVAAMQLDINPHWVRGFTYGRDARGQLTAWALDPAMPGIGMEYLYGFARDFFYVTRGLG